MSQKGKAGKHLWKAQQATVGTDLADRITDQSVEQMRAWLDAGRIPLRVRISARLRGQHLRLPKDTHG